MIFSVAFPIHLARRFRESLWSGDIDGTDEQWVRSHLSSSEFELWLSMQNMDKRHSIGVARRLLVSHASAGRAEVAAALLHDLGKVVSSLGVFGRVMATLFGPRTSKWRIYLDHERIGADLCRDAGVDPYICQLILGVGPEETLLRLEHADEL